MEAFSEWLIFAPLWEVAIAIFGGLTSSAVLGSWLRRRAPADHARSLEEEGYVLGAISGLLALLIGFTFSLAIERFDARRDRVLQEAQTIQTAYLKAQVLGEPNRTEISNLLLAYTDNKIALGGARPGKDRDLLAAKNEKLLTQLWSSALAAFPTVKSLDFSSSFLDTMSNIIEMDAARKEGRRAHVPGRVYAILFVYEIVAAAVFGYVLTGRRGREIAGLLLLLFAMSMLLVIDLDRPATGRINESQDAMIQLSAALHARPPPVFGSVYPAARAP